MFTGIVEETGSIKNIKRGAASAELSIEASKVLEDVALGDSIAVNGVCLTVTDFSGSMFTADVMHETLDRSSLGALRPGSPVNLERAMKTDSFGTYRRHGAYKQYQQRRQCHMVYDRYFRGYIEVYSGERLDSDRRHKPYGGLCR